MIQQLQQVFHSVIKSLEVVYVLEDAKPCARLMVFEDELKKVIDFLNEKKVNSAVSGFKVLKHSAQGEFYSDKSIKIPKGDGRKGYFLVYLSKNKELTEKARLAEEKNSHVELGLLLGYPRCCCEFFERNFNDKSTDLTLKSLQNSNGFEFPFYTNIAARHFDASLLSHFPHSLDCEKSVEIARDNLKVVQRNSAESASMLASILQRLAVYTVQEGIFLLKNHEKAGNRVVYGDILATAKSKLYYLLSSNKELEIIGKNCIIVNDAKIEGNDCGIMLFG
ncbi:hypothetical protein HY487_00340 [Candidatus Woesearchaeota archaeon]|nr:hypothetical protein [Candidatus Woesearchaeota archaeon]